MNDAGIRYLIAVVAGIMLIVAALQGNLGSMLAAFIDASQLQATTGGGAGGGFGG